MTPFTILGVVLAIVGCAAFFALSVCWLVRQEETMKGEEDYPKDRPILKVTVVKDDGNKEND